MPRPRRQHGALIVEPAHQHVDAAAHLAQHVLGRHLAVVEDQFAGVGTAHAHLVELLRGGETLEPLLDQERRDALGAGLRIGLGVHHQHVGARPVEGFQNLVPLST